MIRIVLLMALTALSACNDVQSTTAKQDSSKVVGDTLIVDLATDRELYEGHAEAGKYCYLRHKYVNVRGKFQATISDTQCYGHPRNSSHTHHNRIRNLVHD